ncbi:protein BIC1-like [Asparagus officinalis]|uniref:protein BIC1-like n=1 Tax=Asparagus officinalis TaxID=4686 RepID=UPI00098E3964|nr:protein BIC1-like [Asparagus officinalis]
MASQPVPKKPRLDRNLDCRPRSEAKEVKVSQEESARERLKRHSKEMAGRVWIPDIWGQESLLKDWVDCAAFDRSLMPKEVVSARQALVEESRRNSIENQC